MATTPGDPANRPQSSHLAGWHSRQAQGPRPGGGGAAWPVPAAGRWWGDVACLADRDGRHPGRMMSRPLQFFPIAIGTYHSGELEPLDGVDGVEAEVRKVAGLLAGFGAEPAPSAADIA